jgi:hypothetical protein
MQSSTNCDASSHLLVSVSASVNSALTLLYRRRDDRRREDRSSDRDMSSRRNTHDDRHRYDSGDGTRGHRSD